MLGSYYNTSLLDGNWWLGADSTLRLTGTMNTGEPLTLDGRIESTDSLAIETPYGDTFYFAPAERPGPGGEMGIADLYGTWRMTHYEEDGREYRPGEEHIASMLCFDRLWSDLLEGYPITSPPATSFWSWLRPENLCGPAPCRPSALRWQSPA